MTIDRLSIFPSMNTHTRSLSWLTLAAILWLMAGPIWASAQTPTEAKIRLMADALRARDAGDLDLAKRHLDALAALAPHDTTVQRLLEQVNGAIAARGRIGPSPTRPDDASRAAVVPPAADDPEALALGEEQRLQRVIAEARALRQTAKALAQAGRYGEANATYEAAGRLLPINPVTEPLRAEWQRERDSLALLEARAALTRGDTDGARAAFDRYGLTGQKSPEADELARQLARAETVVAGPGRPDVASEGDGAPGDVATLVARGRAQYLAGDPTSAQATFRRVEAADPDNVTAKRFLVRIAHDQAEAAALNYETTRTQMVDDVARAWQRPGIYQDRAPDSVVEASSTAPLAQKLAGIVVPSVNFNRVSIARVVKALGDLSEELDGASGPLRGVNIVLLDPSGKAPEVSMTLRNLPLKRVLDFIVDSIGYQYEVQADAVVVRPGGETSALDTAFFPITRSTVIRMTGLGGGAATPPTVPNDPFSSAPAGPSAPVVGAAAEAQSLRAFLQQAGVNFEGVPGASLAYDGSAMIVTQTARNVERIRNILNRYSDVRQVEIEAKFMEVQEGALEELGVQWRVGGGKVPQVDPTTGAPLLNSDGSTAVAYKQTYASDNRSLASAFVNGGASGSVMIDGQPAGTISAPSLPGSASLGNGAGALAQITGVLDDLDVSAVIRALSQKQGSDLLSAPKVTVLSGNPATITVAQEMRYPQSYGQIQSEVGNGGSASGGVASSAGVTITAGTPQEFTSRNVGVELKVTPTVEEDDYSISLDLNPKVTEFEGFVEYGGPSIAIASGRTVTVPSGFYQPIFAVREVSTKVTIWDGATLVMGGLTREEIKTVNDKVPILGDIPLLGRLFRSKGESSQKRNLLIFVTANLVSPGGSPKKQSLRNTQANSLFQNPTIVTPASAESRVRAK